MPTLGHLLLRWIERLCLTAGTLGLALVISIQLDAWLGTRQALAAFENDIAAGAGSDVAPGTAMLEPGAALAVLRIPRLDVDVPVFLGTDRRTLDRGAGLVEGTALPGAAGNIVISAHRDSHFRPLQHIRQGDLIELQGRTGTAQTFRVGETFITDPLDVSVLDQDEGTVLTLITCYPFHYVGFAPDRFIVRALPVEPERA